MSATQSKAGLVRVAHVLNSSEAVINKGSLDGITVGQTFLFFNEGPDVQDPVTKESLGQVEVLRGRGRVTHLQDRIATVRSIETTRVYDSPGIMTLRSYHDELAPFRGIDVGDIGRPV
jgi:hypothetical protein